MPGRSILLAEADRDDEALVMLALENASVDADVFVVRDGEAVIDLFLGSPKQLHAFDLVLLDLTIPKLDGLKVLRQLRWLHRHDLSQLPPIVVLAASDDEEIISKACHFGANGFLSKLTPVAQFVDAIQQAVQYWICRNVHELNSAVRSV